MTEKTILIAVPTYEGKRYCQQEFFEALANIEVPDGYKIDMFVLVNCGDMQTDKYIFEIEALLEKIGLPATIGHVDFPYPFTAQTRITFFHNVVRAYALVAKPDLVFFVESDVIITPNALYRLVGAMEANEDAGMVGGVTMYENNSRDDGENRPVMIYKNIPEDEQSIAVTGYSLSIIKDNKTGWMTLNVPVILPIGGMVTLECYSKGEIHERAKSGVPFECMGVSLGCSLVRTQVLYHNYFRFNPSLRYYSDIFFMIDVRRDGWKILCDPTVFPPHRNDEERGRPGHMIDTEDWRKLPPAPANAPNFIPDMGPVDRVRGDYKEFLDK
jgi:hypothetical protein